MAALGEAVSMLGRVDAALERCGEPVLDHVDRIARLMEEPRLTCTSPDGSLGVSAWIEAHAFHHRVVGDGLWIELRDGDETLRTVEMIRLDGSNRIRAETSSTGIRCIVGNLLLPLARAAALDHDAWTRPPLENGVMLTHHLDAETEAGLSAFAGMLAITADVMPEMTVSVVAGRPYAPAQAFGLHGRERDDVDAAASRLSSLIPSQIAMAREVREEVPTWRFGPRVLPERPYDVRFSHADALRIASRMSMR